MPTYFIKTINMFRNASVLIMACVFLCLTYNSTFPLDRKMSRSLGIYGNGTIPIKIKDVTQGETNNNIFYPNGNGKKVDINKNYLNGDDLRQYEQLVIMKKYPFLDLKEIEMKFSPVSHKNARQSLNFETEKFLGNEPGFCEPVDDLINVEIINRGLSGFAIPLLSKHADTIKAKIKNIKTGEIANIPSEKSTEENILQSLKQDINAYIETIRAQVF